MLSQINTIRAQIEATASSVVSRAAIVTATE